MVRRVSSLAVTVLVATLVLVACGSEQAEIEPTVTRIPDAANMPSLDAPTAAPDAGGAATETGGATGGEAATAIDIELLDIRFDKTELTIPADTDVQITATNNGAAVHNFIVTDTDFGTRDLAGGESETITVNLPAGEYEFHCSIPGHKEAGMVGKLIVVAGGAAPADGGETAAADGAGAETTAAADGGEAAATAIDIELLDIRFDKTELTIPANTDVTITATNNGAAVHNFSITDTDFKTADLAGGQSETITVNLPPGEYEYDCTIPGHKEAGMVGKLIVVEGGAASTGAEETAAATESSGTPDVAASAGAGEASPAPAAAGLTGDVERGRTVAAVCLGCHSTDGMQLVGPTWKGLYGSTVTLDNGTTVVADAAYITESIKEPMAKIHQGFPPAMPPFPLSDQDIADIIAYIESLS